MALKPDRQVIYNDVSYFSAATGIRGGVVCQASGVTPGSGGAMDQAAQKVQYLNQPSGQLPQGLLLNDVVNYDLSVQILNPYKSERQLGDKVQLMRIGTAVTNMLYSGAVTGTIPSVAYLGASGLLTDNTGYVASGFPVVGKFISRKDSDGFAKVEINL